MELNFSINFWSKMFNRNGSVSDEERIAEVDNALAFDPSLIQTEEEEESDAPASLVDEEIEEEEEEDSDGLDDSLRNLFESEFSMDPRMRKLMEKVDDVDINSLRGEISQLRNMVQSRSRGRRPNS